MVKILKRTQNITYAVSLRLQVPVEFSRAVSIVSRFCFRSIPVEIDLMEEPKLMRITAENRPELYDLD